MRGNARYSSTGEVVYPAASLGLVLDKTPVAERMVRSQKVMGAHAGQITAMTSHGDMCATAANASVLVWSSADVSGVGSARCAEPTKQRHQPKWIEVAGVGRRSAPFSLNSSMLLAPTSHRVPSAEDSAELGVLARCLRWCCTWRRR